jgi:hypothetical protein
MITDCTECLLIGDSLECLSKQIISAVAYYNPNMKTIKTNETCGPGQADSICGVSGCYNCNSTIEYCTSCHNTTI